VVNKATKDLKLKIHYFNLLFKKKKKMEVEEPEICRRKIIDSIISCICLNAGFESTQIFALETLSEIFITCNL
jgi:hypothetical protein